MHYKMLAVDFDLTLSRQDRSVSLRNQRAIREAEERGLRIVLSSGRMPVAAQAMALPYFSPDTPAILGNGTVLYMPSGDKYLWEQMLPEETVLTLIDWLCRRQDGACIVWCRDRVYVNTMNELAERYCRICGTVAHTIPSPEELARKGVYKLLFYAQPPVVTRVTHELEDECPARISYFPSGPNALELVADGVNKGTGLLRCADYLGISPEETAAIGDSGNDMDMLRTAALSVAVDNAAPEVKALADRIVPSCEDDGVAVLIEQLLSE